MTLQTHYRDIQDWQRWPQCTRALDAVPADASRVSFYRERHSHRGIGARRSIAQLAAKQVNQDFLDEIGQLQNLTYLEIDTLTAQDLSPLRQLTNLQTLKLADVRAAVAFGTLLELASLKRLFIESAKHLHSLEFLGDAHQLLSLGVEGGMWTRQKVASLAPLAGLRGLEALFLTSVQLEDTSLRYLAQIPRLKVLECARLAPKSEFDDLRRLMPALDCRWCDKYEV